MPKIHDSSLIDMELKIRDILASDPEMESAEYVSIYCPMSFTWVQTLEVSGKMSLSLVPNLP